MSPTARRLVALFAFVSVFLALSSCSGTGAPQPGSPGFYWMAAKGTFDAGDYAMTFQHLDNLLTKDDGEYAARALPWALVLVSGMADGHMEAANAYEKGAKIDKAQAEAFRRQMVLNRNAASRLVLQFADKFESFNKLTIDQVPLAFAFPKGSAAEVAGLLRVSTGSLLTGTLVDTTLQQALQRNVILAASEAAGCANDPVKAGQVFGAPNAKVARATFQLAMANTLFSMAQMFSRDKLDDSEKMGILCQRAQNALKSVPESSDTKELTDKIAHALKQMPKKS
jgi:hypothetical protein